MKAGAGQGWVDVVHRWPGVTGVKAEVAAMVVGIYLTEGWDMSKCEVRKTL